MVIPDRNQKLTPPNISRKVGMSESIQDLNFRSCTNNNVGKKKGLNFFIYLTKIITGPSKIGHIFIN